MTALSEGASNAAQALATKLQAELPRSTLYGVEFEVIPDDQAEAWVRSRGFDVRIRPAMGRRQWDGKRATLRTDPHGRVGPSLLHEFAHFVLAPHERRARIGFGLGLEPEGGRASDMRLRKVSHQEAAEEEQMASVLGILIERALGWDWRETAWDHGWADDDGGEVSAFIPEMDFVPTLERLMERGLIDATGRPRLENMPPEKI